MNSFEKALDETPVNYLNRMREAGFLFHGTGNPNTIEEFEPRQASDLHDPWNADVAVYASGEPVWSTIFAIYKGKSSWGTSVKTNEEGRIKSIVARIPKDYQEQLSKEKGYVYILPKDTFERKDPRGAQYKSKVSVKPISRVEVTLQDYLNMDGKIEWM